MPIFRGAVHIHSNWSADGTFGLKELREKFAAAGFHFLLLSEHIEDFDRKRYKALVSECERVGTTRFLFIPGLEFHNDAISICGLSAHAMHQKGLAALLSKAFSMGSFNVLVHPSNLRKLPSYEIISKLHAIEVWNLRYDGSRFPSYRNISIWRLLCEKHPLSPVFGVDFHKNEKIGSIWIEVELETLSTATVLEALRCSRFRLFSGKGEWCFDRIGLIQYSQILGYFGLRRFALKHYGKIPSILPKAWVNRMKGLVNG